MVAPYGLSRFARSTSTWIHCMSPVHSANSSMRCWSTTCHEDVPISRPTNASSVVMDKVVAVSMASGDGMCGRHARAARLAHDVGRQQEIRQGRDQDQRADHVPQ